MNKMLWIWKTCFRVYFFTVGGHLIGIVIWWFFHQFLTKKWKLEKLINFCARAQKYITRILQNKWFYFQDRIWCSLHVTSDAWWDGENQYLFQQTFLRQHMFPVSDGLTTSWFIDQMSSYFALATGLTSTFSFWTVPKNYFH